ncbi:MAG: zinc ribbon domain-containing protein [Lachnospiraceae bacterium]|nr:zinc ribbon domain-containing protein [Lachnospiraceae bacterium]
MFCKQCGVQLNDGDAFCVNCGAKISVENNNNTASQTSYSNTQNSSSYTAPKNNIYSTSDYNRYSYNQNSVSTASKAVRVIYIITIVCLLWKIIAYIDSSGVEGNLHVGGIGLLLFIAADIGIIFIIRGAEKSSSIAFAYIGAIAELVMWIIDGVCAQSYWNSQSKLSYLGYSYSNNYGLLECMFDGAVISFAVSFFALLIYAIVKTIKSKQ